MPLMLRARSAWKSAACVMRSGYNAPDRSVAALEVEMAAHGQDAFVTPLHDLERRVGAEAPVGGRHPAIGEIRVVREDDAQRLVDAEQMADAREQIGIVGQGLA